MGEGVPEEARDPQRDVDPGAAQLGQRDRLEARRPGPSRRPRSGRTPSSASASAASSPPVRMAAVPHSTRPTVVGGAPVSATCRADQRVGQGLADRPTPGARAAPWGRPSRSCGRSAARGPPPGSGRRWARPGRSRPPAPAACCPPRRAWRRRAGTSRSQTQCSTTVAGSCGSRRPGPAGGGQGLDPASGTRPRSCRPRGGARSGGRSPASAATTARSDGTGALGQPGDGQDQVDQRLALGRHAEDVEPAPDLGVLQRAQVAVDVQDHVVELVVGHGPFVPRPRSRWISASTSSVPHLAAAARAAWPGPCAWALA